MLKALSAARLYDGLRHHVNPYESGFTYAGIVFQSCALRVPYLQLQKGPPRIPRSTAAWNSLDGIRISDEPLPWSSICGSIQSHSQHSLPEVLKTRYVFCVEPQERRADRVSRHYSYECKAPSQERPYLSRPSRTQQLLNPKLVPRLTSDVPNDLLRK